MVASTELSGKSERNPEQALDHLLEQCGFRVGQRVQLPHKRERDMGTVGVITKPMLADYRGRMVPAVEVTYRIGRFDATERTEVVPVHQLYDLNPVPPKSEVTLQPITERLAQSAFQANVGHDDNRFWVGLNASDEGIQAKVQELVQAVQGTTPEDVAAYPDRYRIYAGHVRRMISGCDSHANVIASDASRRHGPNTERDLQYDQRRITLIRMWQLQLEEILAKLQTLLPDESTSQ